VDGVYGERTRNAIRAYQVDYGLLVDGQASPELAEHIRSNGNTSFAPNAQNRVYQL